jgi:hypothetical protein
LIASQALRDIIASGLEDCAAEAEPVYMTIETADTAGEPFICERLLLPFAKDSREVTHILAGIELSSLTGSFDRKSIVKRFELQATITLRGKIA